MHPVRRTRRHFLRASALVIAGGLVRARAAEWNVRDWGATGDARTLDTAALQKALDACTAAGGGIVRVPPGDYRISTVRPGAHTTLLLEAGATLHASREPADYPPAPAGELHRPRLIDVDGVAGFTLAGAGAIEGGGEADYDRWGLRDPAVRGPLPFRVGVFRATGCRSLTVRDITVRHGDFWTFDVRRYEDVRLEAIRIANNRRRFNSDGIDVVSCRRVRVRDCAIVAGDDGVVVKTEPGLACEDVLVERCEVETQATAFKIGTESAGDFHRITFADCRAHRSGQGLGLFLKDGGHATRIVARRLSLDVEGGGLARFPTVPVFVDIERRDAASPLGGVKDLLLEDIEVTATGSLVLQGHPERPLEDVVLRRLNLTVPRYEPFDQRRKPLGGARSTGDDGRDTRFVRQEAWLTLAHARRAVVEDFRVQAPPFPPGAALRHAVCACDAPDLDACGLDIEPKAAAPARLLLHAPA